MVGFLRPLDDLYERDFNFDDFLPVFDTVRVDGNLYGFPATGGGYRGEAVFVNRNRFAEAGLAIPGPNIEDALTFEEFRDAAIRLTVRAGGDEPSVYGIQDLTRRQAWLASNGARYFNDAGTEVLMDSRESIEVFELWHELNVERGVVGGSFTAGTAAMAIGPRVNVEQWAPVIAGQFDWSVAPTPAGKAGSVGSLSMNSYAINASSPNVEKAWAFLMHLASDEEQEIRAAQGLAVPSLRAADRHRYLDHAPYDLTPFMAGPTVVEQIWFLGPYGFEFPKSANALLNEVVNGLVPVAAGVGQAAELVRAALAEFHAQ